MAPKDIFVTDVFLNWISQFKISCTNVWRRNVGQGVLALLIGNKKVTDGQTDRPTDMCKAICHLFFKRGA